MYKTIAHEVTTKTDLSVNSNWLIFEVFIIETQFHALPDFILIWFVLHSFAIYILRFLIAMPLVTCLSRPFAIILIIILSLIAYYRGAY